MPPQVITPTSRRKGKAPSMTVSAILRRIRDGGAHHASGGVVPRQTDADYILAHGTDDERAKYRHKLGRTRYKLDNDNRLVLRDVTEIAMLLGNTGGDDDGDGNGHDDDENDGIDDDYDDGNDGNNGGDNGNDEQAAAAATVTDTSKGRKRLAFAEGAKWAPKDVKRVRGHEKISKALRDEIKNMFAGGSDEDDNESDGQPEWQKEGYTPFGAVNDDPKPQRLVVGLLGEDRVIRTRPIDVDCHGLPVVPTVEHVDVWPSDDEKQLSTSLDLEMYVKVAGQAVGPTKEQSWDNVCEKLFQARKKVDGTAFKYWTTWDNFLRRPRLNAVIRAAENAGKTFATPYDYDSLDDKTKAVHEMVATADRARDAVKSLYTDTEGAFGELEKAFDDGNVDEQMLKRWSNAVTAIAVKGACKLISEWGTEGVDNVELGD